MRAAPRFEGGSGHRQERVQVRARAEPRRGLERGQTRLAQCLRWWQGSAIQDGQGQDSDQRAGAEHPDGEPRPLHRRRAGRVERQAVGVLQAGNRVDVPAVRRRCQERRAHRGGQVHRGQGAQRPVRFDGRRLLRPVRQLHLRRREDVRGRADARHVHHGDPSRRPRPRRQLWRGRQVHRVDSRRGRPHHDRDAGGDRGVHVLAARALSVAHAHRSPDRRDVNSGQRQVHLHRHDALAPGRRERVLHGHRVAGRQVRPRRADGQARQPRRRHTRRVPQGYGACAVQEAGDGQQDQGRAQVPRPVRLQADGDDGVLNERDA